MRTQALMALPDRQGHGQDLAHRLAGMEQTAKLTSLILTAGTAAPMDQPAGFAGLTMGPVAAVVVPMMTVA
jgi:hypothetical protein